jgi:hypothetical protein
MHGGALGFASASCTIIRWQVASANAATASKCEQVSVPNEAVISRHTQTGIDAE